MAESTTVDQFSEGPFPSDICDVTGTLTLHGTFVLRETGDGIFFSSGSFWGVFTADNGKSATLQAAGPGVRSSVVIDEQAGTVAMVTTFLGLGEKLSVTNGPTLSIDAGTVTLTEVFTYTGDPDEPLGELIDRDLSFLHGPHPDLVSEEEVFCDVLGPYLQDP